MDPADRAELARQLRIDEGEKLKLYRDSEGILTIGVGRNIEHRGIRSVESALMLSGDIDEAEEICRKVFPQFDVLPGARQRALCNMAFNLGEPRLRGFVKMVAAVNEQRWQDAVRELRDSKWYEQVGDRAKRIEALMRDGY